MQYQRNVMTGRSSASRKEFRSKVGNAAGKQLHVLFYIRSDNKLLMYSAEFVRAAFRVPNP